jgi:protein-disulfide isomerase
VPSTPSGKKNRNLTVITAAIVIAAIIAVILYVRLGSASANASSAIDYADHPVMGDPNAAVKVAMFEDYKCPICKNFDEQILPQLKTNYVDTGKAAIYHFDFPFIGPDSTTAAIGGQCAYHQSNAAFWEYMKYVYRSQKDENEQWATPAALAKIVQLYVPDIQLSQFKSCLADKTYAGVVSSDKALASKLGVQGTPTLFVNGKEVPSTYAGVSQAIAKALAKSK